MEVFQVGELGAYLKELLEGDETLADLWVTGEVTNLSRSGAGHYYFALKDDTTQIRVVLFRNAAIRCGAAPLSGDAVVVHGKVAFYERTGACELCVDLLYPSGVGLAQLRFEALRLKLSQEGLFAEERKRPLPTYPRRIGLVTSEGGAVLHDVLTILTRRYPIAEVIVAHSAVQGDHAAGQIVAALERLRAWRGPDGAGIDVAILARGGGSPEELAPFNDEDVARAVFGSSWPIISAVGHETDVTICDFVADLRAPTPSAAAALVAPDLRELARELGELVARGRAAVEATLDTARADLRYGRDRLLVHAPLTRVATGRQAVRQELERGRVLLAHRLSTAREHLAGRGLQLAALSPTATLARGYSIVSLRGNGVVRSIRDVGVAEALSIQLADGAVEAMTTGVQPDDVPPPAPSLGRRGGSRTAPTTPGRGYPNEEAR